MDPIYFLKSPELAARNTLRQNTKFVILAEGQDDLYFLDEVLRALGVDDGAVQTMDYGGAGELPAYLTNFLKKDSVLDGEISGLMITGDADTFPAQKYKINKALQSVGLPEFSHGLIKYKVPLVDRVSFHLLPDADDGNLETLLLRTVDAKSAAVDARAFVEQHHVDRSPANDKRVAWAYLTTQDKPCRGSGQGARRGYFDIEHAALDDLKASIGKLLAA